MLGQLTRVVNNSYDTWVDAYQVAFLNPLDVSVLHCPNCDNDHLHLIFVVRSEHAERGSAAFWCGTCLKGIVLSPCPVPQDGHREFTDSADIPNFDVVAPPGSGG
jgi:hypothetical protein